MEGRRDVPACTLIVSVTSIPRADDCFVLVAVIDAVKMLTIPTFSAVPKECFSEICS